MTNWNLDNQRAVVHLLPEQEKAARSEMDVGETAYTIGWKAAGNRALC